MTFGFGKQVMLQKKPKRNFLTFVKQSAKVLFVVEAVLFAASYGVWYRMNTNRDFRHYMKDNFPIVLEGYYKVGEIFGQKDQRNYDNSIWKTLNKKSE